MTDRERYRRTERTQDVGFVVGALGARRVPGPVLVDLLGRLGMTASAARNTLATMVRQRALTVERRGRIGLYALAPSTLDKFRQIEGTRPPAPWTGGFSAIVYQAPERTRWYRDRLQYTASYFGYGHLRSGVLIGAHDRSSALLERVGELPADVLLHRVELRPEDLEEARRMACEAWDLAELAGEHHRLDARLDAMIAAGPATIGTGTGDHDGLWVAYRAWNRIHREMIALHMRDPFLPEEILPTTWPGAAHRRRIAELEETWGRPLRSFLREHAGSLDPHGLLEFADAGTHDRPTVES